MHSLGQHSTSPDVSRACLRRRVGSFFALSLCLALSGCVGAPPKAATAKIAAPPKPAVRTELETKDLVILQSDDSPAFAGVTQAIGEKLNANLTVLTLSGHAGADADVAEQLQRHRDRIVVAVGLRAALLARKLDGGRVIFCQVFNYEDFDLLTPWMKGVSAVPPIKQQFQIWKKLDPSLKRVGVITGPRLLPLVKEARAAGAASGIEIKHVQVRSDLETMYAFKRLSPKIQALWLLPDNRILSRNTIRDLFLYSHRQAKQVAVFSEQLLSVGGMMSFESVYGDIAEQVIARGRLALQAKGPELPGPPMLPLTRLDVKINPMIVKQLGLQFPADLREAVYAP